VSRDKRHQGGVQSQGNMKQSGCLFARDEGEKARPGGAHSILAEFLLPLSDSLSQLFEVSRAHHHGKWGIEVVPIPDEGSGTYLPLSPVEEMKRPLDGAELQMTDCSS